MYDQSNKLFCSNRKFSRANSKIMSADTGTLLSMTLIAASRTHLFGVTLRLMITSHTMKEFTDLDFCYFVSVSQFTVRLVYILTKSKVQPLATIPLGRRGIIIIVCVLEKSSTKISKGKYIDMIKI